MNIDEKEELVAVATDVLKGSEGLLEGVRKICTLGMRCCPDDEVLLPFKAIESETDHFPIGSVREAYDRTALIEIDRELARFLSDAEQDILLACKELIEKYSQKL